MVLYNLFPDNKKQVIKAVKVLSKKLDTVNIGLFIMKSFSFYSAFDPSITNFTNGVVNLEVNKLTQKGAWSDELISNVSDIDKTHLTASEYNLSGLKKFKVKDYQGALIDLNKAIEIEPNGQYYFNRAYCRSIMHDYKNAIEDFSRTIEYKYRLAESYFERGYCKDEIKDFEGAIIDYNNAIQSKNDYIDAYNNLGYLYFEQKKFKDAILNYEKVIELSPSNIVAFINRGAARKELGDIEGACSDWHKAYDLGNKDVQKYINKFCK